jgi:hypothetical protein
MKISPISLTILANLSSSSNPLGQVFVPPAIKIYYILCLTVLQTDIPQTKSISKVRAKQQVNTSGSTAVISPSYDL